MSSKNDTSIRWKRGNAFLPLTVVSQGVVGAKSEALESRLRNGSLRTRRSVFVALRLRSRPCCRWPTVVRELATRKTTKYTLTQTVMQRRTIIRVKRNNAMYKANCFVFGI